MLVAQDHIHAQQDRTPGQGEAVDHFDMLIVGVTKALLHTGLEHQATQLACERDAQQGNVLAFLRLQTRSVTLIHGLSFLCHLHKEWAGSARR